MNRYPSAQGLYAPEREHDACGIGFVANIKGEKSNRLLRQSITVLKNLSHRGGVGSEPNSGDGAGILIQLPHAFFKKACGAEGITLPAPGDYGTGILFMAAGAQSRGAQEEKMAALVAEEGQTLLGFRDMPVAPDGLGKAAREAMPFFRQVFIGRAGVAAGLDFERKLFVIRRRMENWAQEQGADFYAASLSSRTIVYKGMLTAEQLETFYRDLADESVETALALVHSRYSTNTFPSWDRAHPNRYVIHNGEINTLQGNVNAMRTREAVLKADAFGKELGRVLPVIRPGGSDSAAFDNCLEFMMLSGMPLEQAVMMMIPEPWYGNESMSEDKKAFYEFNSCRMEPWDGPAAIAFTDGLRVGAVLDRNGLRPSRYCVTSGGLVVLASEVGVLDIPDDQILVKERLRPGRMLLVDTEAGEIIRDEEIKEKAASAHPYQKWLNENLIRLESLPEGETRDAGEPLPLPLEQKVFGYTYEDLRMVIAPLAATGVDPVGAMGYDVPLAVLSKKPQLLYDYFKQLFAEVTNPPIDALREAIVTSPVVMLGPEGDLLEPSPKSCRRVRLLSPILADTELAKLRKLDAHGIRSATLPILFDASAGEDGLKQALDRLFEAAAEAVRGGAGILILSDRGVSESLAPIPALLAVAGVHHFLIREKLRAKASIVLESGEPREVHHFACLIGFGASAINPYAALASVGGLVKDGFLTGTAEAAQHTYLKGCTKGVVKVLSKMGISTIQSYLGAQVFEAVGLSKELVDTYFTSVTSPIGGMELADVARETLLRHGAAFCTGTELESGGKYQYRRDGEHHLYNPETVHLLQMACRQGNYDLFREFSSKIDDGEETGTLRSLLRFKAGHPIPIDEVESVETICHRFKTGAMSFGSISKEAHEAIAIAMNRIGGKSNTGEGGEDPARFIPDSNGDSRCSAIKQVASGRFGVTSEYLVHSVEIQIKMAQGAKPGEGGQLPGRKVYPWVAKVRYSTPGVSLISPPPHHDIYSIEDLKELIYDLKCANPKARISVKLVSEAGVGTIAAGVAKGLADVILISGFDGGTGASPRTSMRHAGLPWELGLAETHQTLQLNGLRGRVVLETDGKLLTGRDIAVAALLGAEEFGFATAPLVTLGCVMMRVCNLDTCPVGIATQNPALRCKFAGDPQYVVNFMHFVAQELREIMARLGFRTVNEMVGHSELLEQDPEAGGWKARRLDLSPVLFRPEASDALHNVSKQDHEMEKTLDERELLGLCRPALETGARVEAAVKIRNIDRAAGTIVGSELTRRYGSEGLPDGTVTLHFKGTAGQSFGAFVPKGMTMTIDGEANDYFGKGLSGGRLVVRPPENSAFVPEGNIIVGNVALYGATSGEAFIRGVAGERFCVRNSGASAVVEGVGDHGCEYMTGGRAVVLGPTGRNFAAGMSGGVAYVWDRDGSFARSCNTELVSLDAPSGKEAGWLRGMVEKHFRYTGSGVAERLLGDWENVIGQFVRVIPNDYRRMLEAIERAQSEGYEGEDALLAAFEAVNHPAAAKKSLA